MSERERLLEQLATACAEYDTAEADLLAIQRAAKEKRDAMADARERMRELRARLDGNKTNGDLFDALPADARTGQA